ncbi:MAG: CotH kinase family protein, partial [Myxococcota bacterium]|nr:CotH kinase family protein [Myxococcota bacterium]
YGGMDICAKFSLKIDFNEYRSSNRLHGLKKLNLHAMAADPTKLHEVLGYGLFRSQDIPASRTAYVQLEINGVNQGLYLAVEQVDGRFTKDRFPGSGDGNLYKQVWPSKGKTKSDFVQALETNDDPGLMDVSDMLAFRDAVVKTQAGTFAADMAPFLDLDALARYIVVDRAIANFDGIFAWYGVKIGNTMLGAYNHNYYWYRDEISGRFVLIPWDLDKTFIYPEPIFWSKNKPWNKHGIVPNWNVVTGSCAGYTVNFDPGDLAIGGYGVQEMDCDKLLKLLRSAIWSQMAPLAKEFIEGPYAQQGMATAIARYRGLIETTVAKDTTIDVQHWQNAVDGLLDDLPLHRENLTLMMSELIEL